MNNDLLRINNLRTVFHVEGKELPAVDGVSLSVEKGEVLCIVGESGSGKTMVSSSIMQLVPHPGKISSGEILFEKENLLTKDRRSMQSIRGKSISMIFQDPMAALDPVYTCGYQVAEAIRIHENIPYKDAVNKSIELFKLVGIPFPERCAKAYPYELSGGMCQRVMIAMALSCKPKLLIADEPTTALDVTIQAQILALLKKIKEEMNMSIILITHDLGVVAEMADRVIVMYSGQIMEEADVNSLFSEPLHPYTKGLIKSIPKMDDKNKRLYNIEGYVPSLSSIPTGCRFNPRCPEAMEICSKRDPDFAEIGKHRKVRCWKSDIIHGGL